MNNIVSTTDVTDYLIENFIIQHEDREEICASGLTTNESNRRLIDKLVYKNGYHQLLKALQHAEYIQIAHEVSNTVVSKSDQKLYHIGKHALMLMGFFSVLYMADFAIKRGLLFKCIIKVLHNQG